MTFLGYSGNEAVTVQELYDNILDCMRTYAGRQGFSRDNIGVARMLRNADAAARQMGLSSTRFAWDMFWAANALRNNQIARGELDLIFQPYRIMSTMKISGQRENTLIRRVISALPGAEDCPLLNGKEE